VRVAELVQALPQSSAMPATGFQTQPGMPELLLATVRMLGAS
jgi:hypothetical protein